MQRQRLTSDAGFSLIEVLMTIVVGMVVLFAALQFMEGAFTSSAQVQDREDSATRSRITLDRSVALLQAQVCNGPAGPILEADATHVKFTANTGAVTAPPKGYIFEYQDTGGADGSGRLIEQEFELLAPEPSGERPWGPTPSRTTVISDYLAPVTAGAPVFTYFGWAGVDDNSTDPEYTELDGDAPGDPSDAEIEKILRVDIKLRSFPNRTNDRAARTSALIDASAYVSSHIDQTNLGDGPTCES